MKSLKLNSILLILMTMVGVTTASTPVKADPFDFLKNPFNLFGRCGAVGEGHITVTNNLRTKVYVLTDKDDAAGSPDGKELAPGESNTTPICNQNGVHVKVYTPEDCGKTLLAESRFVRVYNEEQAQIYETGIKFTVGDPLDIAGRISGFALTYIAQNYGIPPKALAEMGVKEADVINTCSQDGYIAAAKCALAVYQYLPKDLLTTINSDKCLSKTFANARQQFESRAPLAPLAPLAPAPSAPLAPKAPIATSYNSIYLCDLNIQNNRNNHTTIYSTGNDKRPVVRWISKHFNRWGYTPDVRCQEVSGRIQKYQEEGTLGNITNGYINGERVLCIGDKPNAHHCRHRNNQGVEDRGLVLTLEPRENAREMLEEMKDALFNAGVVQKELLKSNYQDFTESK